MNKIGDTGAEALATLGTSRELSLILDLGHNMIRDAGVKALAAMETSGILHLDLDVTPPNRFSPIMGFSASLRLVTGNFAV